MGSRALAAQVSTMGNMMQNTVVRRGGQRGRGGDEAWQLWEVQASREGAARWAGQACKAEACCKGQACGQACKAGGGGALPTQQWQEPWYPCTHLACR